MVKAKKRNILRRKQKAVESVK